MNAFILGLMVIAAFSCGQSNPNQTGSKLAVDTQKDSCDNPDANISCCFMNMPISLTSTMLISKQVETGERLGITGTIFKSDGKTPCPDVILYAYHTDSKGYYSKSGRETGVQKWHGRLHGWCRSDKNGRYQIHTIRPAPYPDNSMPAHIHAAVKTVNNQLYWITDYVFKGDPLVNDKYLSSLSNVGGTGVIELSNNLDNTWTGQRDIVLKQ
jgi:protocatechuate 3,4-dioxygenase beta subunit